MSPNAGSRIVPQHGFTGLVPDNISAYGQVEVVDFSGERVPNQYPAPKAWVTESIPATIDELSNENEEEELPAVAKVHYYRQRQHHHDDTSALVSWFTGLLCIPRTNSGRMGGTAGREESVDSVDFVSTWQKAQAGTASRSALKRPNEVSSMPNTPEPSVRGPEPPPPSELPPREPSPTLPCRATSLRGEFNATCIESRNGRSISFMAQRPPSTCRMLPEPMPSAELTEYLDEVAVAEFTDMDGVVEPPGPTRPLPMVGLQDSASNSQQPGSMVGQQSASMSQRLTPIAGLQSASMSHRPTSIAGLQSASMSQRSTSIAGLQSASMSQRSTAMVGQLSAPISQRRLSMSGQQCASANGTDGRQDSRTSRSGSRGESCGGSRPGSKRSVRFN